MVKVRAEIKGRSFFPGGKGIVDGSDTISNKDYMVLGHDWGTLDWYKEDLRQGGTANDNSRTWRNLESFLNQLHIELNHCFFTNAVMGVRKYGKSTGKSPGFDDPFFIRDCQTFFLEQLTIQKPKLIMALGLSVAGFLAGTANSLSPWSTIKTYAALDATGSQVSRNVVFNNGIVADIVVLMHPSCRKYNLDKRKYRGENGDKAQKMMMMDCLGSPLPPLQ